MTNGQKRLAAIVLCILGIFGTLMTMKERETGRTAEMETTQTVETEMAQTAKP